MNDNQSSDERRRKLTTRIALEEQRISELNTELEQRRALVQRLKDGTDRVQAPDDAASSMATPLAREAKVRLFRTLFRGREDVFPRRWEIVAVCARGSERQRIPVVDLPLPSVRPEGAEWIEAYRQWARGR